MDPNYVAVHTLLQEKMDTDPNIWNIMLDVMFVTTLYVT